jgi:peptide deformylase
MAGYNVRAIVVDPGGDPRLLLNPRVEAQSEDREERQEENLSFPGVLFTASRSKSIRVSYENLNGHRRVAKCRGFLARVILHEIDVLDGKLTILLDQKSGENVTTPVDIGNLTPVTTTPSLLSVQESVLRMKAQSVNFNSLSERTLSELAERMFALQYKLNGVGLAAPQIGISLRMAVLDDTAGNIFVICNPEILDYSEERAKEKY